MRKAITVTTEAVQGIICMFLIVLGFCWIFIYENVYYLATFKIADALGYPPLAWEVHQRIRFFFTGMRDHMTED